MKWVCILNRRRAAWKGNACISRNANEWALFVNCKGKVFFYDKQHEVMTSQFSSKKKWRAWASSIGTTMVMRHELKKREFSGFFTWLCYILCFSFFFKTCLNSNILLCGKNWFLKTLIKNWSLSNISMKKHPKYFAKCTQSSLHFLRRETRFQWHFRRKYLLCLIDLLDWHFQSVNLPNKIVNCIELLCIRLKPTLRVDELIFLHAAELFLFQYWFA